MLRLKHKKFFRKICKSFLNTMHTVIKKINSTQVVDSLLFIKIFAPFFLNSTVVFPSNQTITTLLKYSEIHGKIKVTKQNEDSTELVT